MSCKTKCRSGGDFDAAATQQIVDCGVMGGRDGSGCNGPFNLFDDCTVDPTKKGKLSFFDTYSLSWVKNTTFDYEGFGVVMGDDDSSIFWKGSSSNDPLIALNWAALGFKTADQYGDALSYLNELKSAINGAIPHDERTFIYFGITKLGGIRIFTIGSAPEGTTKIWWVSNASTGGGNTINETNDGTGGKIRGPMFRKSGNKPLRILQQVHPYASSNSKYSDASKSLITDISPWIAGEGALIGAGGETVGRGWKRGPRRIPFFDFLAYYHSSPNTWFKAASGCPADELLMGLIEYGWDKDQARKLIVDTKNYYTSKWKEGVEDGSIQMGTYWSGKFDIMPTNVFYDLMAQRMADLRGLNATSLAQKVLYQWYQELLAAEAIGDEAAIQALYDVELRIPEEDKAATIQLADHVAAQKKQEEWEDLMNTVKKYTPRILVGVGILTVVGGGYYVWKKGRV